MNPRLLLFDIDGTLVDTDGAGRRAMENAFQLVFGVDEITTRSAGVSFAGMTDWSIVLELSRNAGIDASWSSDAMGRLRQSYLGALREEMGRPTPGRVLPGVAQLLERLSDDKEVHLGLLTGNMEAGARTKLEPFGLNRFFPGGAFGSEHPDRRVLARIACQKLQHRAGVRFADTNVVVIGDTVHDIDCAQANGYRAIAVASGWSPIDTLRGAGPDHLFGDLSDTASVLEALQSN